MLQPISELFGKKTSVLWNDVDVKHGVQRYLRDLVRSDRVYCQDVSTGVVVMRVGTPALQQEVILLEYDIRCMLKKEAKYELKQLRVVR